MGASVCIFVTIYPQCYRSYSTTSFAGIGKQKALKLIKENIDDFADLINESACLDVSCDEVLDTVEFICLLYGSISNCC